MCVCVISSLHHVIPVFCYSALAEISLIMRTELTCCFHSEVRLESDHLNPIYFAGRSINSCVVNLDSVWFLSYLRLLNSNVFGFSMLTASFLHLLRSPPPVCLSVCLSHLFLFLFFFFFTPLLRFLSDFPHPFFLRLFFLLVAPHVAASPLHSPTWEPTGSKVARERRRSSLYVFHCVIRRRQAARYAVVRLMGFVVIFHRSFR